MPPTYRVRLTLEASAHLTDIFEFIEQHSPRNAQEMVRKLFEAIDGLNVFPHRDPVVEDTHELGVEIRSMPVRPFCVRYRVDDGAQTVTVLSVWHGARRQD